jgi:hypothetical protein
VAGERMAEGQPPGMQEHVLETEGLSIG